ncbi:ABC transporter substrate-binding protein [Achromobacter spanius]|uniref:ABC transporter substrate-binding protein n=1 Tax=Achromobacter spanius TaxID=217203 RepID=UPI0037FD6439
MMKNLKKTLPLVLFGALVTNGAAHADQLANIKAKGTLVCGVIDIFEPFGFVDPASRSVVGYDVDICNALGKALGVKVELKPVSIEARIPSLQQGHADVLAAGLAYTAQRAQQVDYSNAYYISENVLVVRKSRNYKATADLAGKRISYVKGSISENYVNAALPTAKPVGYDDAPTAFTALAQGRVEAITQSEEVLRKLINKLGDRAADYAVLQPSIGREVWGIGVRKNEPALLNAVNEALSKLEGSGDLQAIFDKWLGPSTLYQMQRSFKVEPIKG